MNVVNNIIFKGKFPKIMTLVGGFIGTLGLLFIFYDEIINFELSKRVLDLEEEEFKKLIKII